MKRERKQTVKVTVPRETEASYHEKGKKREVSPDPMQHDAKANGVNGGLSAVQGGCAVKLTLSTLFPVPGENQNPILDFTEHQLHLPKG